MWYFYFLILDGQVTAIFWLTQTQTLSFIYVDSKTLLYTTWLSYRVSRTSFDLFVFWITRLPKGLKIPYWTPCRNIDWIRRAFVNVLCSTIGLTCQIWKFRKSVIYKLVIKQPNVNSLSKMATKLPRSAVVWPPTFLWNKWPWNCQGRKFYGHFY